SMTAFPKESVTQPQVAVYDGRLVRIDGNRTLEERQRRQGREICAIAIEVLAIDVWRHLWTSPAVPFSISVCLPIQLGAIAPLARSPARFSPPPCPLDFL